MYRYINKSPCCYGVYWVLHFALPWKYDVNQPRRNKTTKTIIVINVTVITRDQQWVYNSRLAFHCRPTLNCIRKTRVKIEIWERWCLHFEEIAIFYRNNSSICRRFMTWTESLASDSSICKVGLFLKQQHTACTMHNDSANKFRYTQCLGTRTSTVDIGVGDGRQGGTCPPQKIGRKFFRAIFCVKFGHFSGKNHIKLGNFVHFHTYFSGKNVVPP